MSLWATVSALHSSLPGALHSAHTTIRLDTLKHHSVCAANLEQLRGRSVVLAPREQLLGALCLLELDGLARRLVLCPPGLSEEHMRQVVRDAEAQILIRDAAAPRYAQCGVALTLELDARQLQPLSESREAGTDTEWILLTSGTTGAPKLVQHSLRGLSNTFAHQAARAEPLVWATFYDTRRYGGLQVLLRGLYFGSLVLHEPDEDIAAFFSRVAAQAVTHISGTPSHWRRVLMSGVAHRIAPRAVRLSGEIADQGVLDGLRAAYPHASVGHAFASTEAGVAFEVDDGLAGFPADYLGTRPAGVELAVTDGTLRVRSPGNATRYLGQSMPIRDADGYVDTGDQLELRAERYFFMGRSGGVINVGGLKVHPEEVEAVINAHPWVRASLVRARRNPITGAVVSAEVVLREPGSEDQSRPADDTLRGQIIDSCRRVLAAHKVPAMVRVVASLQMSASGKLVRSNG